MLSKATVNTKQEKDNSIYKQIEQAVIRHANARHYFL